jgi:hypothetical protein
VSIWISRNEKETFLKTSSADIEQSIISKNYELIIKVHLAK